MNIGYDDTYNYDRVSSIILDIGLKLTKIGFGGESEPRKIIPTPEFFNYEKFIKDDTEKLMDKYSKGSDNTENLKYENSYKNLLFYKKELNELKFLIESFIYNIFFTILQLRKQQRDKNYICFISTDFYLERVLLDVYDYIVKTILDNPLIVSVRLIPKNILPIYVTGYSSGIVIDAGYVFTTITPINNGFPFLDKIEVLPIGSSELERILKRVIVEENIINGKKKIKNVENFNNNIIKYLDDLVVRCTMCVSKKISVALQDPNEEAKLKNEQDYSKVDYCKDVQDFQISLLSRIKLGEKLFGNINDEENNIAYSLLKVLLKLKNEDRKKLSQNIIIAGGTSMLIGFYKRLIEEINTLIDTREFETIQTLKNTIKIHKIIFPRNYLSWLGASLLSGFDKVNMKQLSLSKEDFEVESITSAETKEIKKNSVKQIISYFK